MASAPIRGAIVEVLDPDDTAVARGQSDARGRFTLPPIPPGSYRVRVSASGSMTTTALDLGPETTPLRVTLEPPVVNVRGDRSPGTGQTGSSVTVISRKELQSLPGGDSQTLTQILLTQPGFAPDTFGPDGVMHVRGAEKGVLYVVDGVPLPGGLAGQFADVLPTGLVQGLRMFTGGIPVEYGPNTGGAIAVTSRRGTGEPQGEAQIVYGTYQRVQPSAWYSQAFGKVDVFLEGSFLSTDRGLDAPAASPILHDALKAGDAFARIDYRPDDHDRIELLARYSQHDFQIPIDPTLQPLSAGPPGAMRGPDSYGNSPPPFVPYGANPTEMERDVFAAISYSHIFSNGGSLQLAPYVRSSYGDLNCDPAGSLGATADPGSICSNVTRRLLHEGQSATFAWTTGQNQRWKAGVVLDDAQSSVGYTQFTRDDASPSGGPNPALTVPGHDDTNILLGGVFLQDEITLGRVKIFPGVRADLQNATFRGENEPNLLLAGPSARLGFSYALSPDVTLHAFVGYMWQPPSAVDAAVAARVLGLVGQAIAPDVKAQTDEYGEIGVAYRVPRRLAGTLTAYGRYSQDQLDVQTVGSTNLIEDYNYTRGRAVGAEIALRGTLNEYLEGFGNASWNIAQGQGIDSARYLFAPQLLAYQGWQILDHVQAYTANLGVDVHDASEQTHLAVLFQYGSGLRTGADNNQTVPGHTTWNLTLRHRFDFALHPELALDVFNVFDTVYAIRIANGFVGSAYGPLRQVDVRVKIPFGS